MTPAATTTRDADGAARPARAGIAALAVAAALTSAAALGALVLWISENLCEEVCEQRPWALNWQVLVTVGALAAAAATTVCAVTGRRRAALAFLVLAVALTWPVVADVAADGWSHAPLPG